MRSYNRMSNLSHKHKQPLVSLFKAMAMRLTDQQDIIDFFEMDVEVNIRAKKYRGRSLSLGGLSIQDRFVEFFKKEDDHIVAKAIEAMIKKIKPDPYNPHIFISERETISECKSIVARLRSSNPTTSGNLDVLNNKATIRDAHHLVDIIRRLKQSIDTEPDPGLAIGTAKDLIESVCKTILSEREKPVQGTPNIPTLIKDTLKELEIVPEGIDKKSHGSEYIKRLLNNLGSIGEGLAELRNLYGAGHGKEGRARGLSARHTKLVAGAASTLALFLFETHEENKASTN